MISVNTPAAKRAFHYKQERVKNVQIGRLRNQATRFFAFVLSAVAVLVLLVDMLGRSSSFAIETAEYRGVFNNASQKDIDRVTKQTLNGNFFTVDLPHIKESIEKLPWVQSASLGRKWPSTVVVNVKEYKPLMLWTSGGYVAEGGVLINSPLSKKNLTDKLPMLKGEESDIALMMHKFNQWQKSLNTLNIKIKNLTLSKSGSWEMELRSKSEYQFTLRVGSNDEDARITRFINMYEQDESLFKSISYVDARYPNGVVIQKIKSVDTLAEET